MTQRAFALFGLERGEERTVSLMFLHAFCMGLATVFFETAASALFLVRFHASMIPLTYIAAAGVSSVTGVAYARLERRVSFWPLMTSTLLFLLVTVVSFRIGLSLTAAAAVIFFLFVWYRMLSMLTDLEYWAVATRLYDLQQGKRLFALIGSGEVVARMAGAFAIPLVVLVLGTANLLLVSAGALLACLLILPQVRGGDEPSRAVHHADRVRSDLRELVGDRYVRAIIAVAAFGILGKYFVDFSFLQQMQSRFADAGRLAGFFGLFSGISQALNLLTRVLLSGRFLQRFGIRGGLRALPAAHLVCTLALVATPLLPNEQWRVVFWIVIINQGIYKTLKHPIDNPSLKVLYQPLDRARRLDVQVMNELIASPITIGVAGAVMLLFTRAISFDPRVFGLILLLTFSGWLMAAGHAYDEYVGALRRVLRRRAVDPDLTLLGDEATRSAIRAHARCENPDEAIYALTLLERAGDPDIGALLLDATSHSAPRVRRFAIERLGAGSDAASVPRLLEMVRSEDGSESAAALDALRHLAPDAALEEARQLFAASDVEPALSRLAPAGEPALRVAQRSAVLVTLLTAGGERDRDLARGRVRALGASDDASDRVLACRIAQEVRDPSLRDLVEALTSDRAAEVRRAALESCAAVSPKAIDVALERIGDRPVASTAAVLLAGAGDEAIERMARTLRASEDVGVRRRLLRILGRIGTRAAIDLLRQSMRDDDERIREQALQSLVGAGDRLPRDEVLPMIRADAAEASEELMLVHSLSAAPGLDLLRSALQIEVERAQDRILLQLALVSDAEAIVDARRRMHSSSRQNRALATEFLEVQIPAELRPHVLPVMREQQRSAKVDVQSALQRIVNGRTFTPWTVMCARKALGEKNEMAETTIDRVFILKSVDFFSQTPDDVLAQVANELEAIELADGETIIRKGEFGDSLYIIVRGSVRVHDGERTIAVLHDHQVFGELAVLDPEPRSASVTAQSGVRLFRLDRDDLFELLPDHTEIVRGIFRTLCSRIRDRAAVVSTEA